MTRKTDNHPPKERLAALRIKTSPVVVVTYLLCALALFAAGIPSYLQTKDFVEQSVMTGGKVVELRKGTRRTRGGTKKPAYYVVYTYTTQNGEELTGQSAVPRGPDDVKAGDPVTVLYLRDHPQQSRLKTFSDLWMNAVMLNSMGLIFTLAAVFVWKRYQQYLAHDPADA